MNNNLRNSFIFYSSYYEAISGLPEKEQGKIYKAIIEYAIARKEPTELTIAGKMCFTLIKPTIDSALARYDASVENGKLGGRPKSKSSENKNLEKTQQQPIKNQNETQQEPNQNLNYNYNYNLNYNKEREKNIKEENSLSLIKFKEAFPSKSIESVVEIPEYLDIDLLIKKVKESDFLRELNNIDLEWCINHYDSIIRSDYKTFEKTTPFPNFNQREYTKETLNNLYDSLEDIEVE